MHCWDTGKIGLLADRMRDIGMTRLRYQMRYRAAPTIRVNKDRHLLLMVSIAREDSALPITAQFVQITLARLFEIVREMVG
jgi:hypothetical protein